MTTHQLRSAREAMARRAWGVAADAYLAVDREAPLDLDDLEEAGFASQLSGRDETAAALWARAYQAAIAGGDDARAARIAFWQGTTLAQRGEMAMAGGWLARARRLVEEHELETVERGYVLVPEALGALEARDPAHALDIFERAGAIAKRFGDPNLETMSLLGRGRARIDMADTERGIALLDEAMLAVTSDEVHPIVAGIVYCASIEAFQGVFDLRRAQVWTDALTQWCATQPDLAPFRGRCLVFRAQLMRFHGAWTAAIDEARRAEEWLSRPPPEPAVGEAIYQQAELSRLRGELDAAEVKYREAGRWGRRPEPGLALLRLAQGRVLVALRMLRRALAEPSGEAERSALLEPLVEVAIAAGRVNLAREAAADLSTFADRVGAPILVAMAARAAGMVHLADGDPATALPFLRRAAKGWDALDAPYERARAWAAVGTALVRLGDHGAAEIELDSARRGFSELGAGPDLARLDMLTGLRGTGAGGQRPAGLSPREMEVLRLVAGGLTNRAIADRLVISERTVDRHVSNIYVKLGVTSRSAATAFAYEHGIAT